MPHPSLLNFSFLLLLSSTLSAASHSIGVNYGTVADNLPPPPRVASFLKSQTKIDRIRIFDTDPAILHAFANTGISVTVTVNNAVIPSLSSSLPSSLSYLSLHILPFLPHTLIHRIALGNEILATSDKSLIAHLLPAMKNLHKALLLSNITHIQVSTPHSLGILSKSDPPSSGRFRNGYETVILAPILEFLRETRSPFLVNPYPFFGLGRNAKRETLNYALFERNDGVLDEGSGVRYMNMFDAMMDAVFCAMRRVGYEDVEIVVGETGWPWAGGFGASLENAALYNGNLMEHVSSGRGTPLMPNRTFEAFIFALFNEDLKPGVAEQSYGLFNADFTPVYDVGLLTHGQASVPTSGPTAKAPPSDSEKKWCVAKRNVSDEALQRNIDYVCSRGIECGPIKEGGPCFNPDNVRSHAAYAMNAYYQASARRDSDCYFAGTGVITTTNPSYEKCTYPAATSGEKVGMGPSQAETGGSVRLGSHIFLQRHNNALILASYVLPLLLLHFYMAS